MNDVRQPLRVMRRGMNFSQDGPGNRLVIHLQGCNLRCPWCSNPESMPLEGIELQTNPPRRSCGIMYPEELAAEAEAAKPLMFGGGGVTLTGGEPTMQYSPLRETLERCKNAGIHTCVESNATHPKLQELFTLIDFLILDCKHYNDMEHKRWTGLDCRQINENLRLAAEKRTQLLIRIPLIGGVNASPDDARQFARHFKSLGADVFAAEVLRYHTYGQPKWAQCGLEYAMRDAEISDEAFAVFCGILEEAQIKLCAT
ncbi:MAG: radical SAM protein [Oscillospiraceae bacterium]|jgi:pyruvate formate lyase activating enzyme|nr:radical SAM protein [Oscillospiraceae bacterium]